MKYKFYEKESYVYDALLFPGTLYFNEQEYKEKEDNYIELIPKRSLDFLKEMYQLILPYEEKVKLFYYEGEEDRHFIELLMVNHPFLGEEDPLSYVLSLREKTEEELVYDVLYALDYFNQDIELQDKSRSHENAEHLAKNPGEIMAWINDLPIKNDAKWQLYSFIQKPVETLEEYFKLMESVIPIFQQFYHKRQEEVIQYGKEFVARLEAMEGDSLRMVSNDIVSEKVLTHDEADVIISIVNSFVIRLHTASKKPFIAWGYDIEFIFKAIKENEANQLIKRVNIFKNLGDKTRYEVLVNLAKGITSTKQIAKNLGVSSATISYHLNNLVTAKLVYLAQDEGKFSYRVNHDYIQKALDEVMDDLHEN